VLDRFDHGLEYRDHANQVDDLEDIPNPGSETREHQLTIQVLRVLPGSDNLSKSIRVNSAYRAQIQDQVSASLFYLAPNEISESWTPLPTKFEYFQLGLFPLSRDVKNRDWPAGSNRDLGVRKTKDPCAHEVDLSLDMFTVSPMGVVGLGLPDSHWMKTLFSTDVTPCRPAEAHGMAHEDPPRLGVDQLAMTGPYCLHDINA
jgi:hypothetical protein